MKTAVPCASREGQLETTRKFTTRWLTNRLAWRSWGLARHGEMTPTSCRNLLLRHERVKKKDLRLAVARPQLIRDGRGGALHNEELWANVRGGRENGIVFTTQEDRRKRANAGCRRPARAYSATCQLIEG